MPLAALDPRCANTSHLIDAHHLSPPRWCNAFATPAECARHKTARGICEWRRVAAYGGNRTSHGGGGNRTAAAPTFACASSFACAQRSAAARGVSYVFFKFHKVGSSTVGPRWRA